MRGTRDTGRGDPIGVSVFDYPAEGQTAVAHQKVAIYGSPLQLRKIAHEQTGVDVDYPSPGSGQCPDQTGVGATQIKLAADLPANVEYEDLLVVLTGGTGAGQWRWITSVNPTTKLAEVGVAWGAQPDATTTYDVLVDLFTYEGVGLKTEYADNATVVTVRLVLYDVPPNQSRKPHRVEDDVDEIVNNLAHSRGVSTPAYFHGRLLKLASKGALGAKIMVRQKTGAGAYSLWAGQT
jgi:hypothetical protein